MVYTVMFNECPTKKLVVKILLSVIIVVLHLPSNELNLLHATLFEIQEFLERYSNQDETKNLRCKVVQFMSCIIYIMQTSDMLH